MLELYYLLNCPKLHTNFFLFWFMYHKIKIHHKINLNQETLTKLSCWRLTFSFLFSFFLLVFFLFSFLFSSFHLRNLFPKPGSDEGPGEESLPYRCFREHDHRVPIFRNSPVKCFRGQNFSWLVTEVSGNSKHEIIGDLTKI